MDVRRKDFQALRRVHGFRRPTCLRYVYEFTSERLSENLTRTDPSSYAGCDVDGRGTVIDAADPNRGIGPQLTKRKARLQVFQPRPG